MTDQQNNEPANDFIDTSINDTDSLDAERPELRPPFLGIVIEDLSRLSLGETPGPHLSPPSSSLPPSPPLISTMSDKPQREPFTKYGEWDGQPGTFDIWHQGLKGRIGDDELYLGSEAHVCLTIKEKMPAVQQQRLATWFRERTPGDNGEPPNKKFNRFAFLKTLVDCFQPKDAKTIAQGKIYTIRQGTAQSLAPYLNVFQTWLAAAQELAPVGSALCEIFKNSLNEDLRRSMAIRGGVSETDFEAQTVTIRDIARGIEGLPGWGLKGSKTEVYIDPNSYTLIGGGTDRSEGQRQQQTDTLDKDGDTRMSGINAIGTVSDISAMAAAIVAAINSNNSAPNRGTYNSHGHSLPSDTRPQPPPVSAAVRQQRINNGNCERCDQSPSHPWSKCRYKNFKDNPTPVGGTRRSNVNSAGSGNV